MRNVTVERENGLWERPRGTAVGHQRSSESWRSSLVWSARLPLQDQRDASGAAALSFSL